jgi:2-haloacid dehalogenase
MVRALAFDVYGTLVDPISISRALEGIDITDRIDVHSFIPEWQSKQLQYAWMITTLLQGDRMRYNKFESFSDLSMRALKYITKVHGLDDLKKEQIEKIKEGQMHLQPYPDVKAGLETLRSNVIIDNSNGNNTSGSNLKKMVVLSNGGKVQTEKLLSNIGLRSYFDEILSAEDVQRYKPSSEPYLNTSKILRVEISEIVMVSSNLWDILGAYSIGMKTCWINREQQIVNEEIDAKPDYTFRKLGDVKEVFLQGQQELQ